MYGLKLIIYLIKRVSTHSNTYRAGLKQELIIIVVREEGILRFARAASIVSAFTSHMDRHSGWDGWHT